MIMKNYFMKSSMMLMTVSAVLASCTQEEIVQNDVPARQALNISVNTQDFVSEDGSRATTGIDAGRTTVFAEGDEMGMYVISNDGTVICNNEKFVYNGTAWEAANELYYWKNANYIAYYPYNAELTSQNITSVEAIKTEFAESDDFYTQNTAEAYEKADLMLAKVNSPANGTIQFNLAHQFSMVEINVPVRRYKTTEAQGNFEYTAPVSLTWNKDLKIGDNVVAPYSTGKGSFRFIVPSATDLSLTLDGCLMYDEGVPVYFGSSTESQTINLASGTCKVYNVTYDKVSSDVVPRDLEVGDFYYTDGSIYPYGDCSSNDLTEPVKNGCIGVIFEVGNGVPNNEKWNHGSVLCLVDATNGNVAWSTSNQTLPSNVTDDTSDENKQKVLTQMDGYSFTIQLAGMVNDNEAPAVARNLVTINDKNYEAPQSVSTGWYLPSTGQIITIMQNLGGVNINTAESEFDAFGSNNRGNKNQAITNIPAKWKVITGAENESLGGIWCSANEYSVAQCWVIEWKKDATRLFGRNKNSNTGKVRPVLSF